MSRSNRMSAGVAVSCLALLGAGALGGTADAKKKKKKTTATCQPVTLERQVGTQIPDALGVAPFTFGKLATPLAVNGTGCNNALVANVNVTFQTTGANPQSASDLFFRLSAPDGRTYSITGDGFNGQNIGPVTLTANTPVRTCADFPPPMAPPPPPCADPDATLNPPYAGTARDEDLTSFIGAPVNGTWTWSAFDDTNTNTSTLNSVRLNITAQKQATTKTKKKKRKKK